MRNLALAAVLFSSLTLISPGLAQEAKEAPSSTFVSRSELVLVPVVVTDKSGKHISGLTKADFTLQDDGKAREIAVFENVKTSVITAGERKRVEGGFSNFSTDDASPRRLVIIVIDLVNTPFLSQARVRKDLLEFLAKSIRQDEPTALLVITNEGVREIHPFTTDTRVLLSAIANLRGKVNDIQTVNPSGENLNKNRVITNEREDARQGTDEAGQFDAAVRLSKVGANDMQQRNAIRSTMIAMEQIAQSYVGIPGRKTMIWATSGFPFLLDSSSGIIAQATNGRPANPLDSGNLSNDMLRSYEHAWRALNDANIAIYPISAEGLTNDSYNNFSAEDNWRAKGRDIGQKQSIIRGPQDQKRDTLRSFADATGGKACIDQNDLTKCFTEATEDSEQYYLVGFYLGNEPRKPGWHKLKVHSTAEHASVRARNGYLIGDPKLAGEEDLKQLLATALSSPLDYTGVAMDVNWLEQSPDMLGVKAHFSLLLPASSFTIDTARQNAINIEIAAIAFTPDGKAGPEIHKALVATLKPEAVASIRANGFLYKDTITVPPGKYSVKFVVRDNQSGKMGTVAAPLEVPAAKAAEVKPSATT